MKRPILPLIQVFALGAAVAARGSTTSAPPQAVAAAPCAAAEFRQLDFWVGDWDATWPASPTSPAGKGTNRIEKILDGCVVSENFDGGGGAGGLVGKSYSTYNPRAKQWKQTWVDNQASYMDFVGDFSRPDEKIFAMDSIGRDGKPVKMRMVFFHIAHDSFDWRWEKSTDAGKTWSVQWPIHYTRRKS